MAVLRPLLIKTTRLTNVDIVISKEEIRVDIAQHLSVGFDDLLEFDLDEIVEGVDMLLDKTFDLEERRK